MANQFLKQYKEQRDRLKQHFEAEKTGEQTLFTDQAWTKPFTVYLNCLNR